MQGRLGCLMEGVLSLVTVLMRLLRIQLRGFQSLAAAPAGGPRLFSGYCQLLGVLLQLGMLPLSRGQFSSQALTLELDRTDHSLATPHHPLLGHHCSLESTPCV